MNTPNKYAGTCHKCGAQVRPFAGTLERRNGRFAVRCQKCTEEEAIAKDHASAEDSCCGDSAYEDRCAEACGM